MKNSGVLLLFPLLALSLPRQGESFLAHAASPNDNENFEEPPVAAASGREENQFIVTADSPPPLEDALPLNDAEKEESALRKGRKGHPVTSSSPGTFRTLSLFSLVCGTALILGVLMAKKMKPPELEKGTPQDLALELKMALELLPDAKSLADAVGAPDAEKAYSDAAEFVSQAQKASTVANTEVGAAREKAIGEMRSRLDAAVSALKTLHSETQLAATELLESLPALEAVFPWCEAASKITASTEHVKSAGNVLVSFESAAGFSLLQARLAVSQLGKYSFGSLKDGEVLRESLMDFMVVQEANKKTERLSQLAEAIQLATFKAVQSGEELRRSAMLQLLWEELSDAAHSCVKVMDQELSLSSLAKDRTQREAMSNDFKAAVQLARDGAGGLMAAHSRAVSRLAVCGDPREFYELTEELNTLEEKVKAAVETLWDSVRQQDAYRSSRLLQNQYEQRKLLRSAQNAKVKGENYKQLAMQRLFDTQTLLLDMVPEEQAEGTTLEFAPPNFLRKLNNDVQGLSLMIETQGQKLNAAFDRAAQVGETVASSFQDSRMLIESMRKRNLEVAAEAGQLITLCTEALHVHVEASFVALLQEHMRATAQEFSETLIPDGSGPAALLIQQFEEADRAVQSAVSVPPLAEAAALMGLAVAKLGYLAYQRQRGLFEGN